MSVTRVRSWLGLPGARLRLAGLIDGFGRTPPDTLALEIGKKLPLPPVILHDEEHEPRDRKDGHGVGRPNENCVGTKIGHGM
jgi:hypothetical protein